MVSCFYDTELGTCGYLNFYMRKDVIFCILYLVSLTGGRIFLYAWPVFLSVRLAFMNFMNYTAEPQTPNAQPYSVLLLPSECPVVHYRCAHARNSQHLMAGGSFGHCQEKPKLSAILRSVDFQEDSSADFEFECCGSTVYICCCMLL